MVLKIILITFTLLNFSHSLYASEVGQMMSLLLMERYDEVLELYDELDEEEQANDNILTFKAQAHEGLDEVDDAIKTYRRLLLKYSAVNKQVINAMKEDNKIELPPHNKIVFAYYRSAILYYKKYLQTNARTPPDERNSILSRAAFYSRVATFLGANTDAIDSLQTQVQSIHENELAQTIKTSTYAFLSYVSWQDHVTLIDDSNKDKIALLNTTTGSCTGAGHLWRNDRHEYSLDLCYIMGKSTVSSTRNDFSFTQNSVSVQGILAHASVYWSLFADDLSLGLALPILARSGKWRAPSGFSFEEKSYIRLGLTTSIKWALGPVMFKTSFGKIFDNKSSLLQLAISYEF